MMKTSFPFYPTYEELKYICFSSLNGLSNTFYPTYEELK